MSKKKTKILVSTKEDIQAELRKLEEDSIVDAYIDHVQEKGFHASRAEMLAYGHTNSKICRLFGNLTSLRAKVKLLHPEVFKDIMDEEDLTEERFQKLVSRVKKHKTFLITSAVNGCSVHPQALISIREWCSEKKAMLLILPSNDPAHNLDNKKGWNFDSNLPKDQIVFDELTLNSNIFISSILMGAKQINPTTGLGRITQSKGSAIFASPKQSLEFDAVSNVKFPHARMSTGAITIPDYSTTRFMSERTAYIATHDHVMGGIIVEIVDDKEFHFRQVQFDAEGGFVDLGIYHNKGKQKKMKSKLIAGDYHAEEVDKLAKEAANEIVDVVGCNEIIMHDFHNGTSTNHHNEGRIVTLAKLAEAGRLSLQRELDIDAAELNFWTAKPNIKRITMVRSNHDEFIDRWLEESRFTKDPHNFKIGCALGYSSVMGENPLRKGLELFANLKRQDKIKWLQRDEDYKYAGFELSAHGDKGPNGSRGSKQGLEKSYPKAIIGHSHTSGILRKIIQVGTKSILRPDFAQGPSSWMQSDCIVYENGHFQLINIIKGKWRALIKKKAA